MKISAAVITLNEAHNIARCIQSLIGVVDEIVVMDSHSTDATKEICLQHPVRFIEQDWLGYAAQKNLLNEHLQYEMVLSIDADEALSDELREEIIRLKKSNSEGAFSLNRSTNYCGKWIKYSGWYPDVKVRLFPKSGSKWVGDVVHEELELPPGLSISQLKGHLEHYSYISHEQHKARADHYSKLTAQKYASNGKRTHALSPYLSGAFRFVQMFVLKLGFLDGIEGFHIARISASSNVFKYKEVNRIRGERNKSK